MSLGRADIYPGLPVEVRGRRGRIEAWPTIVVDQLHGSGVLIGQLIGHDNERWFLFTVPAERIEPAGTGAHEAREYYARRDREREQMAAASATATTEGQSDG